MGTVLLQVSRPEPLSLSQRFSPLLDGDGVASQLTKSDADGLEGFSPLLDGDGVASESGLMSCYPPYRVSVPFSMGTVLLRGLRGVEDDETLWFQSPSRWGRCCFWK